MGKSIILSALLVFFNCLLANAAHSAEMLTWEACLREARENNPDLIAAEERVNQARADKAIAVGNTLPQLSSDITQRTSKAAGADQIDAYSYGVSARQLLFDGLKTSYEINAAQEKIKSAENSYKAVSADIRLKLRDAFIGLLKAQELLIITQDITQRRRQNLELVRLRYEAGREHKGSLLTAEANFAQAEFELVQARRNLELAQRRLIKELGREAFAPVKAQGSFDIGHSKNEEPDFEFIAEDNPFLEELISRKEAARFNIKSAKAEFFPNIYVSARAARSAADWPPQRDEWSAGVVVSFPIFEGGSRLARVSRARAAFNESAEGLKSGRAGIILALEQAWGNLQDALGRAGVQGKFLQAAEERARIAQAQYSTGLITFDNWTIIEDDLARVKKSFLQAQAGSLIAEANWVQAKGGMLDE